MTLSTTSSLTSREGPSKAGERRPALRRRNRLRWLKRGVLVAIGLGLVGALILAWRQAPLTVDTATVRRASLQVEIEEDGQTRVRDRYVISAPMSGELDRIELEPGMSVRAGEVVLTIRPPAAPLIDARTRRETTARMASAKARRDAATSAIAKASAAHQVAVREADRVRRLVERGALTVAERDRSELAEEVALRDLSVARAERVAAAAEIEAIEAVLDPRDPGRSPAAITVSSPATGRVLRTLRDSAGPVSAGTPLLEIGDPSALEIVVDVLSRDAAHVRAGMRVEIDGWGGERALVGRVLRVEPSAFTRISALGVEEQRVRVIVALDAPPPALGDGFRVTARIITWRGDDVVLVPSSALFRDRGRWAVYELVDGRAVLRPITVGHRGRFDVEVTSGLEVGARVIVYPGDRVRPGGRVVRTT